MYSLYKFSFPPECECGNFWSEPEMRVPRTKIIKPFKSKYIRSDAHVRMNLTCPLKFGKLIEIFANPVCKVFPIRKSMCGADDNHIWVDVYL